MKKASAHDELTSLGPQRTFTGMNLHQISFPLGGIGTGSVGLTGTGGLRDWEIFNRPNIGSYLQKTFPAIWAREKGKDPVCRVLEGPSLPPHTSLGGGDPHDSGEGFPHMDSCTFRGEFPFAWVDFACRKLPVKVQLEAYNPFIPSNPDDSGFPAAILRYTVSNKTKNPVDCTVCWSLLNCIGSLGVAERDPILGQVEFGWGKNVNRIINEDGLKGLSFTSEKWSEDHGRFGSMALVTPDKSVVVAQQWLRAGWFAPRHDFWDTFSATGALPQYDYGPSDDGNTDAGSLGIRLKLQPGESKVATFYLTWYFPNFEMYWHNLKFNVGQLIDQEVKLTRKPTWKNHYAMQFSSALDVAKQLRKREPQLYAETKKFHEALFSSTVPPFVLDAVSSQMAILKTATVVRLTDGTFYGFEGSSNAGGCCEGSCTHVWNYQQALPFLFPSLERSLRDSDYEYNLHEDGSMGFRTQLPLGAPPSTFLPCADGQLGGVIKVYRDWKICGDDRWLKALWPKVKASLEFAWKHWDPAKMGVLTEIQHNTYDIEFLGPNTMLTSFYLGALAAAAEMADYLGESEKAQEYRDVLVAGSKWVDENLWNGEFYVQKYDPDKAPVHQYGEGCLSDQLLGQWMADVAGLGYVLDPGKVRATLKSIFKYNWLTDLREHANAQRVYALNDEAGLILCSWPRGSRPAVPFVYSDEVWTGIEYQVASHLILEGLVEQGLTVVQGVRDRFDGFRRNPWDEYECGHHYARAMASYGVLLALSGFTYDKGLGMLGFAPRLHEGNFQTFWALDGVWGTYERHFKKAALTVHAGEITLNRLDLPGFIDERKVAVHIGKKTVAGSTDEHGSLTFAKPLKLKAGQQLVIDA